MSPTIFILESDSNRLKTFSEYAIKHKIELRAFTKFSDYLQLTSKNLPSASFINFDDVKKNMKILDFPKTHFTLIYGQNISSDEKLSLYEKGASRVVSLSDIKIDKIFLLFEAHQFGREELKPQMQKFATHGDLGELQLHEILYKSILEKRNFILKIKNGNWFARLRIFQGEIVEAVSTTRSGIGAALEILQKQSGKFRMQSFIREEEICTVPNSTVSLLIESGYQQQIYKNFLNNFGLNNPLFQRSRSFDFSKLDEEENRFIELVDQENEFQKVIQACSFNSLKTIRFFEKLYQIGALSIDVSKAELLRFNQDDIQFLKERIFGDEKKEGRLVVLGYPNSGKTELIKTLSEAHQTELKKIQSLDITSLPLGAALQLNIFGISIDSYFQPVMKKLSSDVIASIFVIDCRQKDKIDYTKYLIQQFINSYHVPLVFGLTNVSSDLKRSISGVRNNYEIPPEFKIIPFNPKDFYQIKQLFYQLKDNVSIDTAG